MIILDSDPDFDIFDLDWRPIRQDENIPIGFKKAGSRIQFENPVTVTFLLRIGFEGPKKK